MKKHLLFIFLLTTISMVAFQQTQAIEERPVRECNLAIFQEGYYFVEDYRQQNYTLSNKFVIYQDFLLKIYLENCMNKTLKIWLPDFENDAITHNQNETLEAYEFTQFSFIVTTIGSFRMEAVNVTEPFFDIVVIEYSYIHFYNQPIFITIVSFPILTILGVTGMVIEMTENEGTKKKLKKRFEKEKQEGKFPLLENPKKFYREELLKVYDTIKRVENIPISQEELEEHLGYCIHGFKAKATNPELLFLATDDKLLNHKKKFLESLIKKYPDNEQIITQVLESDGDQTIFPIILIKEEDLPNEFKDSLIEGNKAAITLAEWIKNIESTNALFKGQNSRLKTELRNVSSELSNVRDENKFLDEALVYSEGSITSAGIYNMESSKSGIFSNRGVRIGLITTAIIIGIALLVMGIVWLINNLPSFTGV